MNKILSFIVPQAYAIPLPTEVDGVAHLTEASDLFMFIIRVLQSIAASVAIIYIILAAYGYITARGDDGAIKKSKDGILYAVIGASVVALAESIGAVFDPSRGINIGGANLLIISITNFLLALIGSVAVIYLVYAGYMYMTARGDAGQVTKATKAIWSSLIGILVALFAYTIISVAVTGGQGAGPSASQGPSVNVGVGVGIGL